MRIIIFFIGLFLASQVFAEAIGRTINLMYFQDGVKILPTLKEPPMGEKVTPNTYIHPKYGRDTRFVNQTIREAGVDITKKIIVLLPKSELKFRFSIPLDHKVKLELQGKESPVLFWNENPIAENTVLISDKKGTFTIKTNDFGITITRLTLEPTFRSHDRKHFIFTVIDSLRGDVPGFNGGEYGVTPTMDEIAKTSIVLGKHLVNSSWTRPSTLVFFTGKYPSKVFINFWDYPVFPSEKEAFYQSEIQPLPALLSSLGYRTIMIGNNPFLTDYRYIGVDVGFEEVYDFSFLLNDTPKITNKFLTLIEEWKKEPRPLFLFLNYNDPHKPYEPPFEYLAKVKGGYMDERKRGYLGEVAYVDSELGKIIEKLKQEKLWDDTFFFLTSDHGEVMEQAHAVSKFTGVYTLFGHGQGLYEEDIHTPFLFRYPKQIQNIRSNQVSRSIDIMPTILDTLNIVYDEKEYDGKSLIPLWEGFEKEERIYYGESRGVKGVRIGGWKFMKKTFEFHRTGPAWDGVLGEEKEYLFRYDNGENEKKIYEEPAIRNELKKNFSLGNTEKNLYCLRIHSTEQDSHTIRADVTSKPGRAVHSDKTFNALEDADVKNIYGGFRFEKKIQGKFSKEYCFYSYPDISLPFVTILVDGRPIVRGELGVGSKDIFPENCPINREECLPLYLSTWKDPDFPKKFRIQLWALSQKTKVRNEKVILEKDALDILRKQGYVK